MFQLSTSPRRNKAAKLPSPPWTDFNLLQNFRSAESRIIYYAFDIRIHRQRNLIELPLSERRAILSSVIEPGEHIAISQVSDRSAAEMLQFIKDHGLEGAVAKRSDSCTSRVNEGALEPSIGSAWGRNLCSVGTFPAIWVSIPLWWGSTVATISYTRPG
jgi:hypothetical protein